MEQSKARIRLRRDSQQWEFDRAIADTGRVYHYQHPGRGPLPSSVKMHSMISKHLGKRGQRFEQLAASELAAGHRVTALEFYFEACLEFARAQHTIMVNNTEKQYLHAASIRCYDEVRKLAPTRIEHLDFTWGNHTVSGNLHLAPGDAPAPLVFFVPGVDMTKEMLPHPLYNWAGQRGMHLFVFDGPGQGESNIRNIPLTITNYEEAVSSVLDELIDRPEIDADRLGVYAMSYGSYWGARIAAVEPRISAAVLSWASICDKYYLFEEESPRYKQLFSFLTRARSEEELDEFIGKMGLEALMPRIACPTLLTIGEFDPRSPLEEVYNLFDSMKGPAELWVYSDQHHMASMTGQSGPGWQTDYQSMGMDWLSDRLTGVEFTRDREVRYIEQLGPSPYDPKVSLKRRWFEEE